MYCRAFFTSLGIVVAVSLAGAAELAVPRDDWDAVFFRNEGWTGGDAAYSVALPGDRILWLFADSWIGRVELGKHAHGSRLVNNALAIHADRPNGTPAAPDDAKFHWGPNDDNGQPTAWITPDRSRIAPHWPPMAEQNVPTWYWVADGITTPDQQKRSRLLVFLWHIGRTKGTGIWTFAIVGGALAVIDNPEDSPERWQPTQYDNPHAVLDDARAESPTGRSVTWGSELLLLSSGESQRNVGRPWLYIYGTRTGTFGVELLMARAPAELAEKFDLWEFRTSSGWSSRLEQAAPLARELVSEFSVCEVEFGSRRRWLLTQSQPLFGEDILVRAADEPWGPWSRPVAVYRVPELSTKNQHFSYAAKAHPAISTSGKLLLSYLVNSHDFSVAVNDAGIYHPRFVEIDLPTLGQALAE